MVFSPFQIYEYLLDTIKEKVPNLNIKQLKKLTYENVVKVYQSAKLIFIFTPSHLALACIDLAITQMSQSGDSEAQISSFTEYFPDISLEILDNIGKAKELLNAVVKPNEIDI